MHPGRFRVLDAGFYVLTLMFSNLPTRVSFLRVAVSLCRVESSLCLGVDVYIICRLAFAFFDSKFYLFESEYHFSESQVHISRTAVLFRRVEHYGILRAAGFSWATLHFVLLYCRVLLKSMADNPIITRLQSMAVFVKILGAPKTRIWVRVRKKWSGAPVTVFQVRQNIFKCA